MSEARPGDPISPESRAWLQRVRANVKAQLFGGSEPPDDAEPPAPRVDEVAQDVDGDSRALYFTQSANGVPVRMALLSAIVGLQNRVYRGAT